MKDAYAVMGTNYMNAGNFDKALRAFTMADFDDSGIFESQMRECRNILAHDDRINDIEDTISANVMGYHEPFNFFCSQCGECCRKMDHILVSPCDLFRMTRSQNMRLLHCHTTTAIRQAFKDAFSFSSEKDVNVILMYLRPAQSDTGQCKFAYSIYVGADGQQLPFKESWERMIREDRPLEPSEYNLTEEEEIAAIAELDEDEDKSCSGHGEDEWDKEEDEPDENNPSYGLSINSFGRHQLGCAFGGIENMPTACASYPLVMESSWVHFFDPAESSGENNYLESSKFIVKEDPACEGLYKTSTPERASSRKGDALVKSFVERCDLETRYADSDWFVGLIKAVNSKLPQISASLQVKRRFISFLALIWYDFDALRTARNRPIKNENRLKRIVQELTLVLMDETIKFQAKVAPGVCDVREYDDLVRRLGII